MKKLDWTPEIEIIRFDTADIIHTSETLDNEELPPLVFPEV